MPYPDDLLTEGEQVVINKHPHWKMLIIPVLVFLIVVGAVAFVAALVAREQWHLIAWLALLVVGLLLIIWRTVTPWMRWRTTHFIVTTRRVMTREGVLNRVGEDIPLSRINSVRFEHGLIDRMWGSGTLIIESASDEPLEFHNIPRIERVHSLLYEEVNENPYDEARRHRHND
ncbi:MAG TPA: PH domain-containing protein [Pseudonocardiaceae bacterium]|nr:PH domain-containing protein [Pseudonocardiaceae bacterium]